MTTRIHPYPRPLLGSRRRVWTNVVCATFFVLPSTVLAQARDPLGAEELFRNGKALLKAGDWPGACKKFETSMELEPSVSTMVKIAKCREHEGLLASAWYDYERALKLNREIPQTDRRRQELDAFIRARVAELEPQVPKLRITVPNPPKGLEVERDGTSLALVALAEPLPVDPGVHELVARAPGYVTKSMQVDIAAGKVVDAELVLVVDPNFTPPVTADAASTEAAAGVPPAVAQPPPRSRNESAKPPPPASDNQRRGQSERWIGVGIGSAGLVTLGVASYFWGKTISLVHDMNAECVDGCTEPGVADHDRAVRARNIGLVVGGVGAAMLVTGIVLYATADSTSAPHASTTIAVGPGFLAARGSF